MSEGCTHVAMESSGVYWKPAFNILEESMEVLMANARHINLSDAKNMLMINSLGGLFEGL